MGTYTEAKRDLLEALLIVIDQKIAYYDRERCGCDDDEVVADREECLATWKAGRERIVALAEDPAVTEDAADRTVREGSLVRLDLGGDGSQYLSAFVVPHGAGQTLTLDEERYLTVTADSELGAAILGAKLGETATLTREDREIAVRIDKIDGQTA